MKWDVKHSNEIGIWWKRIISLLLVWIQSLPADCAVKAEDVACLLFLPYEWHQDFSGAGRSRDDGTFPSSHGALTVPYILYGIVCSQFSPRMFFPRTLQCCSCKTLCNSNTMRGSTLLQWARWLQLRVKLGEQDWKITQLGTDTSPLKYSQME